MHQRTLGGVSVDVQFKRIKNVHLSVYPPTGRVRIAAPERMKLDAIRLFAISKLGWIKQQQKKIQGQEREMPREYIERESHYVWGKRYLLQIVETDQAPSIEMTHRRIVLRIRPGTGEARRSALIEAWYRGQMKKVVPSLISKWELVIGVKTARFFVQKMRTKWGSCNARGRSIRLNTDLAKKPRECLEYIVVHELVHLLEPTHNARFVSLMNRFVPNWKFLRQVLNRLPVKAEHWTY